MLIFTNRSENLGLILPMNALAQLHLHHPPPSDFDFIINVMDCLIGRCPPYLIANYLGSIFSGLFEWQHRNGILVVGIDYDVFIKSPGTVYLINCGSLENLHRNANFQPKFSDGFCLVYKHVLAPNATFNFKYLLSQTLPTGMRMGCILRPKMRDHIIDTPQLEADINPSSLTTNLSLQYHPNPALRLRFSAQLLPRVLFQKDRKNLKWHDNISFCAEHYASYLTSTISLYNPSRDSGRLTLTQLKSFSSRLAFGFEILTEWQNKDISDIVPAIGGRYFLDDKSIAATVSFRGIDFTFWHLINGDNQLATSFIYNRKNKCSLGTIFYQWLHEDIRVRGSIDSDGAIGVTCFSRMYDLGCNAELSLLHCIPTQKFSLGLKFEFESALD